jgi:hypothetical protein
MTDLEERIAARHRRNELRARLIRTAADAERLADHEVEVIERALDLLGKP